MAARIVVLVAVAALVASAATAGPVVAARGGNAQRSDTYGSCSVTPNPVAFGSQFTIAGAGFKPSQSVVVFVQGSGGTGMYAGLTNSSGGFSIVSSMSLWAGTNTVTVYDGSRHKLVSLTSCPFDVV